MGVQRNSGTAGSAWNISSKRKQEPSTVRRRGEMDLHERPVSPVRDGVIEESRTISDGVALRQTLLKNGGSYHSEPHVDVETGNGAFAVRGSVESAVHPDVTYAILRDYHNNARVFSSVESVDVEEVGDVKLVTQHSRWKFFMMSGCYDVTVKMKETPAERKIAFELEKSGVLKVFNGTWNVEPLEIEGKPLGSRVVIQQHILPAFVPAGSLDGRVGSMAGRVVGGQMKSVLADLAKELWNQQE